MPRRPAIARIVPFALLSGLVLAVALDGPSARSQAPAAPAAAGTPRAAAAQAGPGSASRPAATPKPAAANAESLDAVRAGHVRDVLAAIAGREKAPAKEVFENVTRLGEMPAERLVRVMEMGYARSLGVGCDHCHVPGQWASDEKPAKTAARGMIDLVGTLNGDLLPKIEGLRNDTPIVNCTTCHRGAVTPALNLGGR
jgi:hypothetical protein